MVVRGTGGIAHASCPAGRQKKTERSLFSGEIAWPPVRVWHGAGSQQGNTEDTEPHRHPSVRWQKSPAMDCTGTLDWARGLLSAGGLGEEPEPLKVTAPQGTGAVLSLAF